MYFFDLKEKVFLVQGIHNIPSGAIPVSEGEYQKLVDGRAKGGEIVLIGNALSLTPPRPSPYHTWNGTEWAINKAQQQAVVSAEKSAKLAEINRKAQAFVNQLAHLDDTPEFERETWSIQREEVKAWFEGNAEETPTLALIAQARGVPLDVLRQKAYEKAKAYQTVAAVVAGQRQAYEDRLNRAETLEQIRAIEPSYQLPQQGGSDE